MMDIVALGEKLESFKQVDVDRQDLAQVRALLLITNGRIDRRVSSC